FYSKRTFDYDKAVDGMRQILWGLFKKIVIADNCAVYVNQVFDNYEVQTGSTLLIAAIFFAFQIYGDFSGYSDIAIGTARLFGFNLMRNFNFPYFSRDIAEFWRRWHISLSTWFRDYLYIPLGGSRGGKWMSVRNTLIIFTVSGFWHGANWTFIAWGAFHGLLFLPLLLAKKNRKNTNIVAENRLLPTPIELFQMGTTFLLVVIGWIFFRADSIADAVNYMQGMLQFGTVKAFYRILELKEFLFILILLVVEWLQRNNQHGLESFENFGKVFKKNKFMRILLYYTILCLILWFSGEEQQFIYFQF
ncbi:MAG: MBOAT family protein, partial [Bacteroidales bacterium]|nr:MBOAT family protein [Bacteroidales bacterium]